MVFLFGNWEVTTSKVSLETNEKLQELEAKESQLRYAFLTYTNKEFAQQSLLGVN